MATLLKKGWWILLVRGLAAVLLGVVALVWPGLTVATLILYFGAFALVDGISDVIGSIMNRKEDPYWWLVLLGGLASIVAGALVFAWPQLTALFLLYMIAARALVTGILDVITAIRLRKEIEGEVLLILGGLASVLFGLIAFARPGAGALAVISLIAIYALFVGGILMLLAFRMRRWGKKLEKLGAR
jgi:uncharacterized membrane protein HdeD (DUF308 family)